MRITAFAILICLQAAVHQAAVGGIVVDYVIPTDSAPDFVTPTTVKSGVTGSNLTRNGLAKVNQPGFYSNGWSGSPAVSLRWGFSNSIQALNLSRLQVNIDRPMAMLPNTFVLSYRSSAVSDFTEILNSGSQTASPYVIDFDLSSIAGLQNVTSAEFRLSSTNYNGTIGITNNSSFLSEAGIVVFEDLTPVPEPATTTALAAFGAISAFAAYRRRRTFEGTSRRK